MKFSRSTRIRSRAFKQLSRRRLVRFEQLEDRRLLAVSDLLEGVDSLASFDGTMYTDDAAESVAAAEEVGAPVLEVSTPGVWVAQGPSPTINAQVGIPPNNDVNGAIQSLAPHPTDANILYIGSVNGGVWKTTNATATNPTWVQLTDDLPSLSIGDIQFDLTDPTFQTLIAGTGRVSNFAQRGDDEIGVYRTTNGGTTWTLFNPAVLQGQKILGVAARGSTLMAASRFGGVYRSINSGATWTNISGTNGLSAGGTFGMVADAANPNRFYVAVSGTGVFRTDDLGATWTNVAAGLTGASTSAYIRLAVHNSLGNNVVYAAVAGSGAGVVTPVFRSTNQGATWTAMDSFLVHNGGQQFPDTSLAADPINPNIVYLAGDRIAASPFTGLIARGDASLALGTQWTTIVQANAGNTSPHADTRDMEFMANGVLIESDDGGMYRRSNPTSSAGVWSSIAGNLQVFEIHDIAWNAISNTIVAGTQDNGTHQQPTAGATTWNFFNGGDGGDVAVDSVSLAGSSQAIRYFSSQNLGGFRRQVVNASNTVISTTTLAAIADPLFVTPIEINTISPTRLLIGGSATLYESIDQGTTNASIGGPGANRNAMVYGGSLGGLPNADLIYVGFSNQVWKRTAPGALSVTTALPAGAGTITDVAIDPNNYNSVFAVDDNQVFFSSNGGTSWTDITGNIGTMSTFDFRTVEFVPGPAPYIAIGTRSGAFVSRTTTLGTWLELGSGLPNVLVFDLEYDASDDVLIAGTLGRAVWKISNASTILTGDTTPPTILDVKVGSPTWNASFVNVVDSLGTGYPIPDGPGQQSVALPWNNINRIHVLFSEDVGATFTQANISLSGVNIANYASLIPIGGVTFNSTTRVGTIALNQAIQADKLRLTILSSVTDAAGNQLDGEWVDDITIGASGNGTAGGNFVYRFNILPGDISGEGVVLGNDITAVVTARSTVAGGPGYNPRADIDASGVVLGNDVTAVTIKRGTSLPAGSPPEVSPLREPSANGTPVVVASRTGSLLDLPNLYPSQSESVATAPVIATKGKHDRIKATRTATKHASTTSTTVDSAETAATRSKLGGGLSVMSDQAASVDVVLAGIDFGTEKGVRIEWHRRLKTNALGLRRQS